MVVNTIIRRFQDHKLFSNQKKKKKKKNGSLVERLQRAIASGIKILESKRNGRLGQPKKGKNVTKEIAESFMNSTNLRRELDEYYRKLQDASLTAESEGKLCKVKTLISCKALFGVKTLEPVVMAANCRIVWVGEALRGIAVFVTNPCLQIGGISDSEKDKLDSGYATADADNHLPSGKSKALDETTYRDVVPHG